MCCNFWIWVAKIVTPICRCFEFLAIIKAIQWNGFGWAVAFWIFKCLHSDLVLVGNSALKFLRWCIILVKFQDFLVEVSSFYWMMLDVTAAFVQSKKSGLIGMFPWYWSWQLRAFVSMAGVNRSVLSGLISVSYLGNMSTDLGEAYGWSRFYLGILFFMLLVYVSCSSVCKVIWDMMCGCCTSSK